MATLKEILQQVRERIRRSRSSHINEQNTKAALIDPVLRALGWDIEDWEEVQREFRGQSGDNPVDYALVDRETKKPLLFLEAKALGENLEDRKWAGQIMGYAHVAGVQWVVLTNGDEYRIYNAYAEVPVEDKIFRQVCMSDDAPEIEGTLVLLSKQSVKVNEIQKAWDIQVVDEKLHEAVEALFVPTPDAALVNLIRKRMPELSAADVRAGLQRVGIRFEPASTVPPRRSEPLARPAAPRTAAALKTWETRRRRAEPEAEPAAAELTPDLPERRPRRGRPRRPAASELEPTPGPTDRHRRYLAFWEGLLAQAREDGVTTHAGVSPSRDHWLHAGAGRTGLGWEYVVSMRDGWAAVDLYIDTQDREENKRIFDSLLSERERIEGEFGAPLDWQRLDEKRASRVRFLVQQGGVPGESRWPQLQDDMVSAMGRLSAAPTLHTCVARLSSLLTMSWAAAEMTADALASGEGQNKHRTSNRPCAPPGVRLSLGKW